MERLNKLADNLRKLGYEADVFENKEDAANFVSNMFSGETIGIGGSQTVGQMNLYDLLASNNTVYWHDRCPENLTVPEVRKLASSSPVYISSVNGIDINGVIINIDNTGNRVGATTFGPDKVVFVIGRNKVADTYEEAFYRARNVASPLNARRLNRKTPCVEGELRCYDCKSPERICRNFSVFAQRPTGPNYHVILINEDLGY